MAVNIDAIHYRKKPYKKLKQKKKPKEENNGHIKYTDRFGLEWIIPIDKIDRS